MKTPAFKTPYKRPPTISPAIEATAEELPANPCTAPWMDESAVFDKMASSEGHIRPFPTASNAAPP